MVLYMYDESIRTDNPSTAYLGQIYDPIFGTTTAELVTQIRLKPAWDGKPFTIDSVKLYLRLLDVKGGSGSTHKLSLSEISEQIYTDSAYYSNSLYIRQGTRLLILSCLNCDPILLTILL